MSREIEIRPATINDILPIALLHANNWKRSYRGILSDHYLDHEVDQDRLDTWKQKLTAPSEGQHILTASYNNTLVGFCCFVIDEDPVFGSLIDNLHVSIAFQKKGIGKKLIHESARIIAQAALLNKVYLWVYEANIAARAAYNSIGGTIFETVEKLNEDGSRARCCRCVWNDIPSLLSLTAS